MLKSGRNKKGALSTRLFSGYFEILSFELIDFLYIYLTQFTSKHLI